jgi:hypothetical protein
MPGRESGGRVPVITAAEMGYGHLRPAQSIADALGLPVHRVDALPLADPAEVRSWNRHRRGYEFVSRLTQPPFLGRPFRFLLDQITRIDHLHPKRDQSRPTRSVKALHRVLAGGVMGGLFDLVREAGGPLVTTFYAPAIAAELHGIEEVCCVVTDSDIHRIWAPLDTKNTRIRFLVPSLRALRRLRAYGVPRLNIEYTGFPLPGELVGGEDSAVARRNLSARLCRLDPEGAFRRQWGQELPHLPGGLAAAGEESGPPLITFAVGGAGAQVRTVLEFLRGLSDMVRMRRLRIALVAGIHAHVAEEFERWIRRTGLGDGDPAAVRVLFRPDFRDYYREFNRLLSETDILWTKPSELVFYAALGLPLLLSWPIGHQERYNRRFLLERGAGLKQRDPRFAGQWIEEMLAEGTLAATALSGYMQLPRQGTNRIAESITKG